MQSCDPLNASDEVRAKAIVACTVSTFSQTGAQTSRDAIKLPSRSTHKQRHVQAHQYGFAIISKQITQRRSSSTIDFT